jgi:hypothetical protein
LVVGLGGGASADIADGHLRDHLERDTAGAEKRVQHRFDVPPDERDPVRSSPAGASSTPSIAVSSATSPTLGNDSGERMPGWSFIGNLIS